MSKVLVIEDDRTFSKIVEKFLLKKDFQVECRYSGKEGINAVQEDTQLVLLDYRLPDMTGLEVLPAVKKIKATIPVIIMTTFADVRTAVKAVKAGAFEYITKPVDPDELLFIVNEAIKDAGLLPAKDRSTSFITGKSAAANKIRDTVQLVAPTDLTVIIEGESGTGKENTARSIHQSSMRSSGPFVTVDCGVLSAELAVSELFGHKKGAFTGAIRDKIGQIEAANGGTLFLDEVGNLSYDVQAKLLRSLQERVVQPLGGNKEVRVDVRIITATNDDLLKKSKSGQFREDLFHRLNEFRLVLPPLRERGIDILEFMEHFRSEAEKELGRTPKVFSEDVTNIFLDYDWPGNLRELRNVVRRAVLLTPGTIIERSSLPGEMAVIVEQEEPAIRSTSDLKALNEIQEREVIIRTLRELRFNKSKTARALNIDRKTLYLKMEKYRL